LIVRDATGSVYGVTYKWRPDNSDAELLASNLSETILIKTASGVRTQTWYYPSRQDCRVCHTDKAADVLGVKTRQINRLATTSQNRSRENQLTHWNRMGLFEPRLREEEIPQLARLAAADDRSRTIEDRARSYLDANCAACHRPGGTVAYFDARYDTPLPRQGLIEGQVLIDQGIDKARVIAPNDIWRSIAFMRANTLEPMKMPPLAHENLDQRGLALLREWIESLPGPKVLAPPAFSPAAGKHRGPIQVTIADPEPGVTIRYTTDGSVPTKSDPLYEGPITLAEATTLRAKAFKEGFTRSITAQATYIVNEAE
jgi:mono/diheme cytochrome c family protein